MAQPITPVLALGLVLMGTAARAQSSPALERRERSVTVTGNPADPPHEIHAAMGVATVLLFKSRINGASIEVDRARVKIIDAGEWSIIFEPVIALESAERLVLSVLFADGQRAVFVLVPSPTVVDTRVEVIRREQTVEACQAELAEEQARCAKLSPVRIARAGWLTPQGVIGHNIRRCSDPTSAELVCANGTAYRAATWALVDVELRDEPDHPPWVPSEITIKGMKSGVPLVVRAVEIEPPRIGPGERSHVYVEIEPPASVEPFVLELRDAAGRGITIGGVDLSARGSER